MLKQIRHFIIFVFLFCSFECSQKNVVNIVPPVDLPKEENYIYSEQNMNNDEGVPEISDIYIRLEPILNNFSRNENPLYVLHERMNMATSIILEYIKENDELPLNLMESLSLSKNYEAYKYFSPDGLLHVHTLIFPYDEKRGSSELFFMGHSKLYVSLIQYETKNGKIITIPMSDIVNMLDIKNIELMNAIRIGARNLSDYQVSFLADDMYIFGIFFRYNQKSQYSFFDDDFPGNIIFLVKYEETGFTLQRVFNNKKYLLLFNDIAKRDDYVVNGTGIVSGDVVINIEKIIGEERYDGDTSIYDYKEIKLIFNGSEFVGDYEYLFRLNKKQEPPNFNINYGEDT
jgi:hypothetical protein